jgi:predicted GH43/DUF377 family glycosyl hydrolase
MTWTKRGRIFDPDSLDWAVSHAQNPTARHLRGDVYRVYFAARNKNKMSRIGFTDLDLENPHEPRETASKPVLSLGELGTFDDSGVFPHWVVKHENEVLLYYTGWMRGDRVPYYAAVGLARRRSDEEQFHRVSRAPILSRTDTDPFLMHSPCVMVEEGTWRLWYSSATGWGFGKDDPKPRYHIRYAESPNGRDWDRDGTVCIDFKFDEEWAIARPCVRRTDNGYRMWYCYSVGERGYRIGCAHSSDGVSWTRHDDAVDLEPSDTGWDSGMVCYPYVFEHDGSTYMLYNGTENGKLGFGLAERTG